MIMRCGFNSNRNRTLLSHGFLFTKEYQVVKVILSGIGETTLVILYSFDSLKQIHKSRELNSELNTKPLRMIIID